MKTQAEEHFLKRKTRRRYRGVKEEVKNGRTRN